MTNTKAYFLGRYNSLYFTRLCLYLLICSDAYGGFPAVEKKNKDTSLTQRNITQVNTPNFRVSADKIEGFGPLNLNNSSSFSTSQSQGNQNRTNRDTGFGTFYNNKENSIGSSKPSLWEIFKTNLLPKVELKVEVLPDQNANTIAHSQDYFKYNHVENTRNEHEDKQNQDTLAWNPWEKIKSAARKSILISYLMRLGQNFELKQKATDKIPTSGDTERHSPEQQERGKLIHDSLKTFLRVQNGILNYILGKHGQPLLKTTSIEPTKQPSLRELIFKPFSHLVNVHHNSIESSHHPTQIPKSKPAVDLTSAPSEEHSNSVLWNAWHLYPWKENPKWDPWTYNYHVQRPETEGTILRFWKKLLWNALKTKKQIITSKAAILPLLVKIKINVLKKVLQKIAHKEKSPTFLLLRVIKNALWKGKKAFIRHFLKTKSHISSFKSKLKYFKHTAPSPTPDNSYGNGQDISDVHLTYNRVEEPPAPTEKYHSAVRPLWSQSSSTSDYQLLLPPVVSENPIYSQTEYTVISPASRPKGVVYTSDYRGPSLDSSYGEIVPVPAASENTYSQGSQVDNQNTRPFKKNASFSSQLLKRKINR